MKKLIFIGLFFCFAASAMAQPSKKEKKEARKEKINALIKQEEEGVIIYHKHTVFGFGLTTDGYGAIFEKGWKKDKAKASILRVELYERKHPKEDRITNFGVFGATNSFIYAKLNNFYQLRVGYGLQRLIGSKGNKNGIEVSAVGTGGLTLGLLKPYYYDVQDGLGNRKRVTFDTDDTTAYTINGASGVTYGWNQVKLKPGVYLKPALRFDYGRFNEMVSAIEVGICAEFFSSKIPQIYLNKEKQFFFNGFVTLVFGKRK